jgi:hypothetical protein
VQAVELPLDPDWVVNWDNTVTYNLGVRAQGINPEIGNNPAFAESDYKFAHAGDVVTNRVSDLSEFDAVYDDKYGFRVSASIFKDFAYGNGVNTNPANIRVTPNGTTNRESSCSMRSHLGALTLEDTTQPSRLVS